MLMTFRSAACLALLSLIALSNASAQQTSSPSPAQDGQAGDNVELPWSNSGIGAEASEVSKQPYRVGKDVKPPKVVYDPDPPYSSAARAAGFQATVILWLIAGTDGLPHKIKVVQGAGMGLDQAAIEAVDTWRFEPATKNGQPVPVMINVEVNFKLNDGRQPPLFPGLQASATPPQFPGVNLAKYPLVVHISKATGLPAGSSYEISARATVTEAAAKQSFSISCSGKASHCPFLATGTYPAKWIAQGQRLEILGKKARDSGWEKAEYTAMPDASAPSDSPQP